MSDSLVDDTVVVSTDDNLSETIDENRVVLNLDSGTYYALSGIGDEIWTQVQTPISVEDVCNTVCEMYEVADTECRADVLRFLSELRDAGLIEVRNDGID